MPQHHSPADAPIQTLVCGVGWPDHSDLVRVPLLGDRLGGGSGKSIDCSNKLEREAHFDMTASLLEFLVVEGMARFKKTSIVQWPKYHS